MDLTQMTDRRRVGRVTIPWHLSGWVHESWEVRILDLSIAGVRIEHVEPLRPGASCSFDLPPALGSLRLSARVVWSLVIGGEQTPEGERRLHYQSGLAFNGVLEDQQAVLASAVEKLSGAGGAKVSKPPL